MLSLLGRLSAIAGTALMVYSLFIPAIVIQFPMPPQEIGGVIVNLDMRVEASLYNFGDKLSELDEDTVKTLPKALNYLWTIFFALAILNLLWSLKPESSRIIRAFFGLMPIAIIAFTIYKITSNPELKLDLPQLSDYLTTGFYYLVGGSILVLLGGLLIDRKMREPA